MQEKLEKECFLRILAECRQSFGQFFIAVGAKAIVDKCLFFRSKILMTRASGSIERHLSMQFVSSWQGEIARADRASLTGRAGLTPPPLQFLPLHAKNAVSL